MAVYKEKKKNTWEIYFYYKFDGKSKQIHRRNFKTRKEALEFEKNYKDEHNGIIKSNFKNLFEVYIKECGFDLKLTTINRKKMFYRLYFKGLENKELIDISTADLKNFQINLLEKDFSNNYLGKIQKELSAFFNYAVKNDFLKVNLLKKIGYVKNKNKEKVFKVITEENFLKLFENKEDNKYFLAVKILFYTGIRVGELLALERTDFKNNSLNINKTFDKELRYVTQPKTESSIRTIKLSNFLVEELKEYSKYFLPKKRLFEFTRCTLANNFNKLLKSENYEHLRLHDLRHSHATMLIQKGFKITDISRRLGHSNSSITLNVYSHFYENSELDISEKLENDYQNITKQQNKIG